MYKWGSENGYNNHLSIWVGYEKPSSSYCVMWCYWWGCRRNLNLITLESKRVNLWPLWIWAISLPAGSTVMTYSWLQATPDGRTRNKLPAPVEDSSASLHPAEPWRRRGASCCARRSSWFGCRQRRSHTTSRSGCWSRSSTPASSATTSTAASITRPLSASRWTKSTAKRTSYRAATCRSSGTIRSVRSRTPCARSLTS